MIDGLTFGVAAGAAFAAAETIVVNRGLFSSFGQIDSPNAGFWVSLILSAAVVKPIVYGAATGIAVASYSGLGAGYDGFKPGYFRGLAEALIANIVFQGGLFFAARARGHQGRRRRPGVGRPVAAALVVRLRYLLHFAVLEAALEAGVDRRRAQGQRQGDGVLPLVRDAAPARAPTSASRAARRCAPAARSPGAATASTTPPLLPWRPATPRRSRR